jgi:hypothetical protein
MGGGGVDIASCCSLGVKLVVMYLCCLFFAALMLPCCDRFFNFDYHYLALLCLMNVTPQMNMPSTFVADMLLTCFQLSA